MQTDRKRDPKTGRLMGWGYEIKYENGQPLYKLGKDWVKRHKVPEQIEYCRKPERIEYCRKAESKEKVYFQKLYTRIKTRSKEHKEWSDEFDFEDGEDLLNHWNKQQEKHGNRCPITRQILTTVRGKGKGKGVKTMTNISPDRLFCPITYTKQNTLFTTTGWNLSKNSLKFYEMPRYLKHENCQRHFKILQERFPEFEDIGWEAIDGYDWRVA